MFVGVYMHTVTIFLYLSMLKTIHTHTFNSNLNTSFLFYHIYNSLLWQWENWFLFSLIYLLIWPILLCVTNFLPLLLPPPLLYSCPPHPTKIMKICIHGGFPPSVYTFLTLFGLWHPTSVSLSIWMRSHSPWAWHHLSVDVHTWMPSSLYLGLIPK